MLPDPVKKVAEDTPSRVYQVPLLIETRKKSARSALESGRNNGVSMFGGSILRGIYGSSWMSLFGGGGVQSSGRSAREVDCSEGRWRPALGCLKEKKNQDEALGGLRLERRADGWEPSLVPGRQV